MWIGWKLSIDFSTFPRSSPLVLGTARVYWPTEASKHVSSTVWLIDIDRYCRFIARIACLRCESHGSAERCFWGETPASCQISHLAIQLAFKIFWTLRFLPILWVEQRYKSDPIHLLLVCPFSLRRCFSSASFFFRRFSSVFLLEFCAVKETFFQPSDDESLESFYSSHPTLFADFSAVSSRHEFVPLFRFRALDLMSAVVAFRVPLYPVFSLSLWIFSTFSSLKSSSSTAFVLRICVQISSRLFRRSRIRGASHKGDWSTQTLSLFVRNWLLLGEEV